MHFIFKPQTSCLPWEPTLSVALRRCCTGSWLLNPSVTPEASVSVAQASDKGSSTFHSGWRICLSRGSSMHPYALCTQPAALGSAPDLQVTGLQPTPRGWAHSPCCLSCMRAFLGKTWNTTKSERWLVRQRQRGDISQAVLTSDVTRLAATEIPGKKPAAGALTGARRRAAPVLRSSQRCTQFSLFNKSYSHHTDSLSLAW